MQGVQFNTIVENLGMPALFVSSLGLMQAESEGARRLIALPPNRNLGTTDKKSIHDLGLLMVPNKKPVYRDLNAIVLAAAGHIQKHLNGTIRKTGQAS